MTATSILLAILAFAPSAALADVEPNDGIAQAEGPLHGATDYTGRIANDGDLDTYVFYVYGQQQMSLEVTHTGGSCFETARLGDTDNRAIASSGLLEPGETATLTYSTPPGTSRYYLELFDGTACGVKADYTVRITPQAAVAPGPSTPAPMLSGEPNEDAAQAIGPLLGDVFYAGELQTLNDQDWFKFYTAPGVHQIDITATLLSGCEEGGRVQGPAFSEGEGSLRLDLDEWNHLTFTSPSAGAYSISFGSEDNCVGEGYEFAIQPASALSTVPPPPPPQPSAPQTPPPLAPPPAPTRGYVEARYFSKVRQGDALVRLVCSGNGACEGALRIVYRKHHLVVVRSGGHRHVHKATRRILVGNAPFSLAKGQEATVTVPLSRKGAYFLHRSRRGRLRVFLSGLDVRGRFGVLEAARDRHKRCSFTTSSHGRLARSRCDSGPR